MNIKLKLPEGYLEAEERDGFLVSVERKKIWAVELDLMQELDRICRKYDLLYLASGGTMLGAMRHHGFIPWDDDIDVYMPRKDYDKLCQVAPAELTAPYFFQTEYTDPGSFRGHAQLRNSDTTGILKSETRYRKPINQGIFIDIFPADKVIDDPEKLKCQVERAKAYKQKAFELYLREFFYQTGKRNAKRILWHIYTRINRKAGDYLHWYRLYEEECARYNDCDTEFCTLFSFMFDNERHFKRCAELEDVTRVPFEMITIPVTREYDDVLTRQYGSWREFVVDGNLHGSVIFDTETGYEAYIAAHPDLIGDEDR